MTTNYFKEKLQLEVEELETKLEKLDNFLMDDNNVVEDMQKALLQVQATAMNTYLQCLKERLCRL